MITDILVKLILFGDSLLNNNNSFSDLITRCTSFFSTLNTSLSNIANAFSYLYFFIPKAYFDPLITIFLLIMLVKCIMAIVNLIYP